MLLIVGKNVLVEGFWLVVGFHLVLVEKICLVKLVEEVFDLREFCLVKELFGSRLKLTTVFCGLIGVELRRADFSKVVPSPTKEIFSSLL